MAAVTTCSDSAAQIIIGAQINFGAQIIKMCLSSWSYWLKKKHMTVKWRLYLGQNEDYSLGDTISDSSEGLLWRGKRGAQYTYKWFWWRKIYAIKHAFWHKITASHKKFAASREKQVSVSDFNVFLHMRRFKKLA